MWFKKKKTGLDYKKCNFNMSIKAYCYFELISGKSIYKIQSEEDIIIMLYCGFITSNPNISISIDGFKMLLESNKGLAEWLMGKYSSISKISDQFKDITEDVKKKEENTEDIKVIDLISKMVAYGIDPHYIMNEMEMWEIVPYFKAIAENNKEDLVKGRMWAYLNILPHVDSNKLKSPSDLITFSWEEDEKPKPKSLDEMTASVLATFEKMSHKNTEEDE